MVGSGQNASDAHAILWSDFKLIATPQNASCHHLSFLISPQTFFLLPLVFPVSPLDTSGLFPFSASVSRVALRGSHPLPPHLSPNFHQHIESCEPLVCNPCMPLSSQPLRLHCRSTPWSPVPTPPLSFFSLAVWLSVFTAFSLLSPPPAGPVHSLYAPLPLLIIFSSPPLIYSLSCLSSGHFLNGSYCSFEEGECSWQSITGRGLSWRRLQSPANTRQACPSSGGSCTSLLISWTLLWSNDGTACLQTVLSVYTAVLMSH